jgi:polyisoprenoid-binding protein YceI
MYVHIKLIFMKTIYSILTILAMTTMSFTAPEAGTEVVVNPTESKVVWEGKKVGGAHTGTIAIKSGNFTFEGDQLTGGTFTIDMTTLGSTDLSGEYKDKLDGHLKSDDFFGVATFPTSTLTITEVVAQGPGKYKVTGDITIKGITKSIKFPAEVSVAGDKVTSTANITLDRSEFNVRYGSGSFFDNLGDKVIYDDFALALTVVASK